MINYGQKMDVVVGATVTGPSNTGPGYTITVDGQEYDGVPSLAFSHFPGEPVHVGFAHSAAARQPIILGGVAKTTANIPLVVYPAASSVAPAAWGTIGQSTNRAGNGLGTGGTDIVSATFVVSNFSISSGIFQLSSGTVLCPQVGTVVVFINNGFYVYQKLSSNSSSWQLTKSSPALSGSFAVGVTTPTRIYLGVYGGPVSTGSGGGGTAGS